MNVCVIGGSGFIGSHVVDAFLLAGHWVKIIDTKPPHRPDVAYDRYDIMNYDQLVVGLAGTDVVCHLAATADIDVAFMLPRKTVATNIYGTTNVLEAARHNNVKRVIFASTVFVYSAATPKGDDYLDEDSPLDVRRSKHTYTTTKIAAELLCHNYQDLYDLDFSILRYGIPYGPRMRDNLVIPIFIKKAMANQALTIHGSGEQFRNYVYIDDLARAHVLALKPEAINQIFNIEGDEAISIRQLAEQVAAMFKVDIKYLPGRPGDYAGAVVSNLKARQLLDWRPQISFMEGLQRTADWLAAADKPTAA